MNERIRELARQAGIAVWGDAVYMYDPKDTLDSTVMEKFAALVAEQEREECAKVADRQNGDDEEDSESCVWSKAARHIAAAIRERGSK
jgi:hypothetical protein